MKDNRKILEDIRTENEIKKQLRYQRAKLAQRLEPDGRPRVDTDRREYDPLLEALKQGKR